MSTIELSVPYRDAYSIGNFKLVFDAVRQRFPSWADQCEPYVNVLTLRAWNYETELHSDDSESSRVYVWNASKYEIYSYDGDCEGAHAFIESAHVMEESHALLDACKMLLKVLVEDCDAEAFGSEIAQAEGVIADAERA